MKKSNETGVRLFFIEFLIVLFFFLIVSTICLRLFTRAHLITRRADELSHAQAVASSTAAAIEYAAGNLQIKEYEPADDASDDPYLTAAAEILPGAELTSDGLSIAYDKEFQPCSIEEAGYMLMATVDHTQTDSLANIVVENYDHELIYELSATFHRPMTRKEALQ